MVMLKVFLARLALGVLHALVHEWLASSHLILMAICTFDTNGEAIYAIQSHNPCLCVIHVTLEGQNGGDVCTIFVSHHPL